MNKFDIRKFDIELFSGYELNKDISDFIIEKYLNVLLDNKDIFEECLKMDNKKFNSKITLDDLIKIVKLYKDYTDVSLINNNKLIIIYGNPYIVIHLCMQAFFTNTQIVISTDGYMNAVNDFIVSSFNKVLAKLDIYNLIYLYEKIPNLYIENIKNLFDEVVSIGNSTVAQVFFDDIKYYAYNNLGLLFYESNNELLKKTIIETANEEKYELEIYYEKSINQVIDFLKNDKYKEYFILLTDDEATINYCKRININQKLIINENPFKDNFIIKKYL